MVQRSVQMVSKRALHGLNGQGFGLLSPLRSLCPLHLGHSALLALSLVCNRMSE